jgi:hypothetical protein
MSPSVITRASLELAWVRRQLLIFGLEESPIRCLRHPSFEILLFDLRLEFWVYITQGDRSPQKALGKVQETPLFLAMCRVVERFQQWWPFLP